MKKNLPKKLKIGSMIYDVVFPAIFPASPEHQGMYKNHTGTIEIVETGNYRKNWKILMHEVIHAIDHIYCNGSLNEFETELVSSAVISLAIDNDFPIFKDYSSLPQSVRMFSHHYDVVEAYDFPETMSTSSYMDFEKSIIYFADPKVNKFSSHYMKLQLIYNCVKIIPVNIFGVDYQYEAMEDFPVCQFSNGLLETFSNYDFETALRKVYDK
jgi:hypothetical protein